ncbi:MAG: ribose 5-phosphate isomerase B [Alphaproteobacteria bacterium]
MIKKIVVGTDHAGFLLKQQLVQWLHQHDVEVIDVGTCSEDSVDYPEYTKKVVEAMRKGAVGTGLLICGSGIGMSIGANRFKGIRAALCWNKKSAYCARRHNDANILVLGARLLSFSKALTCLSTFITTSFQGEERHLRRIKELDNL